MAHDTDEIRGVLIDVVGGRVLLPNATVSEIITLSQPDPLQAVPDWLLGRVPWRGWRLPLFSFAMLAGLAHNEPRDTARVCILKAFGEHKQVPFMAMLAQGFPHLTTLREDVVQEMDADGDLPAGVLSWVAVNGEPALIPDMLGIEERIAQALAQDAEAREMAAP